MALMDVALKKDLKGRADDHPVLADLDATRKRVGYLSM
jgi:hypothetical protein